MTSVSVLVIGSGPDAFRDRTDGIVDPDLIHWADHIQEAVGFAANLTFDVVFIDVDPPDGLLSLQRARDIFPEVPLIAISDSDDVGFLAVEGGADDHLLKNGFGPRRFRRAVRFALARNRRGRQSVIETGEFNVAARSLVSTVTRLAGDLEAS